MIRVVPTAQAMLQTVAKMENLPNQFTLAPEPSPGTANLRMWLSPSRLVA